MYSHLRARSESPAAVWASSVVNSEVIVQKALREKALVARATHDWSIAVVRSHVYDKVAAVFKPPSAEIANVTPVIGVSFHVPLPFPVKSTDAHIAERAFVNALSYMRSQVLIQLALRPTTPAAL